MNAQQEICGEGRTEDIIALRHEETLIIQKCYIHLNNLLKN